MVLVHVTPNGAYSENGYTIFVITPNFRVCYLIFGVTDPIFGVATFGEASPAVVGIHVRRRV